jgi:hypothetical protein
MHDEPKFITHEHNPVFGTPPLIFRDAHAAQQERVQQKEIAQIASREAAERDMAYVRAMNPPPVPKLEARALRQPVLPAGFDAAQLDKNIYSRGVAFDRERLLSLGRVLFDDLLARDHDVREHQRVLFDDLTSWPSVLQSFAANNALVTNVPRRTNSDIVANRFTDRDAAALISNWEDLWKIALEPESVRRVYAFHDAFVSLVFGQSLLERLSSDGHVRSHWFSTGKSTPVVDFKDWLSTLQGAHFKVVINDPLFSVVTWLCGERQPAPDPAQLANDWLGIRVPSLAQTRLVQSVVSGWLLGHASWSLWDYVGRRTRQPTDHGTLSVWRAQLADRYKNIARFHSDLKAFFLTPAREGYVFQPNAYRAYLDRELQTLLDAVSLIAAFEMRDATVARFDWILCEGSKPKARPTAEHIELSLEAAFHGARFNVNVHEVS